MRRIGRAVRKTPWLKDLPREVAVLSAVAFSVALGFGILAPSLPIFADTFGVSAFAASAVISVFALMRFISAPAAGAMVDRVGERTVMASGLFMVGISSLAAGFSQTYWQLIVLRGAGGIGSAMFTVSAMALLLRVVDGFIRKPIARPAHRWVIAGGQPVQEERHGPAPEADNGSESRDAVESGDREPAA